MAEDSLYFVFSGALFGLSAGIAPGPLLTLVISQTLRCGAAEGVKVAASPLITDIPIIAAAIMLMLSFSSLAPVLGVLSISGAAYVGYLGWATVAADVRMAPLRQEMPHSLRRGVLVNATNPHPYIFWFTVGGPMLYRASRSSFLIAGAFLALFYGGLVGVKILLAWGIGRYTPFFSREALGWASRLLGAVLMVFALLLFRDGIVFLSR